MPDEPTQDAPDVTQEGAAPESKTDPPADTGAPGAKDGEALFKGKPAEYWYSQATKAFTERDKARAVAGTVSESEKAELEELRKAKDAAEEAQRIKEGDFETAKAKYQKQVEEAEARVAAANDRYATKAKENAFNGATSRQP